LIKTLGYLVSLFYPSTVRSPNVGLLVLTIRDAGKGRSVEAVSGDISSMVTWVVCEPLLRQQRFFDGVGIHGNRVRSIGCGRRGILDERLDDSIGV
jgi:hypothetical protein